MRTKYNSYKQNLVAKNFPLFQEGVLDKITVKNGFSLEEVREYKKKLRDIAIESLGEKRPRHHFYEAFQDASYVSVALLWSNTKEGSKYWSDLNFRLKTLKNIPTLKNPITPASPASPILYSVQGKDKFL